jgi:hypothetical protein
LKIAVPAISYFQSSISSAKTTLATKENGQESTGNVVSTQPQAPHQSDACLMLAAIAVTNISPCVERNILAPYRIERAPSAVAAAWPEYRRTAIPVFRVRMIAVPRALLSLLAIK